MTRVSASALAVDEVFLGARWMLRGRELVRRRRMRGWAPAGGHGGGGKTVLTGYRQVHLPKRCQLTSIKVIAQLHVRVFLDVPSVLCLLAQDVNWPGGLQSARHSLAVFFCTNLAVELGVSLHVSLSLESHCPLRFARPPRARLRASLTKSPLQQTYALLTGSRRSGWLGPSGAHFWDLECGTGRREARRRLECEGVQVCSNTPGR